MNERRLERERFQAVRHAHTQHLLNKCLLATKIQADGIECLAHYARIGPFASHQLSVPLSPWRLLSGLLNRTPGLANILAYTLDRVARGQKANGKDQNNFVHGGSPF